MNIKNTILGIILLACAGASIAATPVLLQPQVKQDGSIQLRWQSDIGAVYSIESTETLSANSSGDIPFINRDIRVVSQGTETTWLDYGDATMLDRLYHPAQTYRRFYRVEKIDQTGESPVTISITQPVPNSVVYGDITVGVSVNTVTPVGRVRFFVDGQPVDEKWETNPCQFTVNTTEWINGAHVIHATVEMIGDSGTTGAPGDPTPPTPANGASPSVTLTFDNLIHDFTVVNPFFDPYDPAFPDIQIVYAALAAPSDWTATVVDENDAFVRGYSGSGNGIFIAWDGTDSFGTPMPPGYYDYILSATAQQGQGASALSAGGTGAGESAGLVAQTTPLALTQSREKLAKGIAQIAVTESPYAKSLAARTLRPLLPWFMQSKPDPVAIAQALSTPAVPPIPPLVRTKRDTVNWETTLAAYLQMSNNIVATMLDTFAKTAAKREARLAALASAPISITTEAVEPSGGVAFLSAPGGQTTRNPNRTPGRQQMSYTGATGAISQGNHPPTSQASWSYGPLANANAVAEGFVSQMAKGAQSTKFPSWKNNFHLKDSQVKKTHVVGQGYSNGNLDTTQSWFNRYANMGMLVGHTVEYNPPDFPASTFGPSASYPLLAAQNPNGYTWIPDWEMRFGSSNMRWMAYFGCNVLRQSRWLEVSTRGTWPINFYVNVYCATATTIYMYPTMGRLWAEGMQGELDGVPMTVVAAWGEAGQRAHKAENTYRQSAGKPLIPDSVIMSYLYWNASQEGGADTRNDRFQPLQIGGLTGRSIENLHYGERVFVP